MADEITALYNKAREKGVLTNGLTEQMFREQTATDEGLRSFYDIATANGMKFHPYDEFKQHYRTTTAETTQQQHPTNFWQSVGAPDPYPQKTAEGIAQAEKDRQLQRESAATMPLSQQDKDRQAEIQRLQTEGTWGKPNGITMNIDKQTGLPVITQTDGDGMHLSIGATPANQEQIDRLKAEQPAYITREIKTPQDLYTSVSEAWAANTPDGQKAKAELDKTAQDTYNNLMADINRQIANLQQQVNNGTITQQQAQQEAQRIADNANAIYENEVKLAQDHFTRQMADANADYLSQQTRLLGQKATNQTIADINARIAPHIRQLETERQQTMQRASQSAQAQGGIYGAIGAVANANTAYKPEKDRELALYHQSQQFLADAAKISQAAQQGQGFWKGLGKSLSDIDTWDFGISQLTRSANLKNIVEKYERGEQLTDAEKGLMDSAVAYMSACAYNSDKLSRLYKAGQTTGESIPFMLQFMAMPIGAIKDKIAKGILGYGIEQFGGKAAQAAGKAAAKYGAKTAFKEAGTALLGNLAAAGVQTAAFGVPKIAEGAISRITGDIQPDFDEQGNITYGGRQNQQGTAEAIWNSTVDMYAENLSEMIMTTLDPLKALAGTTKLFKGLKSSQIAQVLGRLNEGVIGKVRDRAQFRNYLEEVSEEYVGNLLRWGLSTDINNAEDAGFSADQQIDTWLGLAPTSIAFGAAGAVQGGIDRFQSSRAAKRLREIMQDGAQRQYLESLLRSRNSDDFSQNAHEVIKSVLRNNQLNDDAKRMIMDGIYSAYQSQLAQEAQQTRTQTELSGGADASSAAAMGDDAARVVKDTSSADGLPQTEQPETNTNEGIEHYQDTNGNEVTFYRNADGSATLRDENGNPATDENGNAVTLTQTEFEQYTRDTNLRRVDRELTPDQWTERENQLRRQYAADIQPNTHSNGNVYEVSLASDETKRGYIVGDGNVEIDNTTDPAAPRITNADVVTVRYEDGTMAQVTAKDLNLVSVRSANDMVEQQLQPFLQYAQVAQTFHAGQEVAMDDGNGNTYTSRVVSVSAQGVEVEIENPQGEPDTTIIPNEIALTALHPAGQSVEQSMETTRDASSEQQPEQQEPFVFVKTDAFGNPIEPVTSANIQPEQTTTVSQPTVPNIDTMSYSELGAATVEYMGGDRAAAVAYLEAERSKAETEVKRLAKQSVKNYTDIADFKRQNDELQAAKKIAADRYNKLQNAITAANHYQTQAEQAEQAARKAREEEQRVARRQTQTAQLANPAPAERWQAAPKVEGNAVARTLPDGTTIRGHYVLVEAGAATPSHDPFNGWNTSDGFPVTEDGKNINDRDYKNDQDARQITTQIAQTYDGQAVTQVPVVSSEGIVYDGNGRTIAGNIAAANNTDGAYIQALADNAGNFGFTAEQVAGMQHPRVYMQTDEDLPYNTTTFAKFNAQEKKSQGSTNRAVSSSKKLTEAARDGMLRILDNYGTLDAFFASETGAKDIVRSLLDNGIITQQEVAGLTENTDRGFVLSPAGKDYVTDLLIGGLFDEQTIRMLGNDKGLKQSILRAMPSIIENRRLGGYALTDNINGAIRLLYEARQAGVAYPLYIRQVDAFEGKVSDRFTPFEMLLAEEMSSGVENFRQVLNLYNNSARDDANGQTGLFEPRTIEDIKNEILQHYANRKQQPTAAAEPTARPANPQTQPPLPSTPTGARQGQDATDIPASNILEQIEAEAEPFEEIELTPENWYALFGEDGIVSTPIGYVKMGEHQYLKLAQKGRDGKLGMIKPTLEHPSVVVMDKSQAKDGQTTEREFSYVFVKAFVGQNGERLYYFTSITVSKDGQEVVVSNQEKTANRIAKLIQQGKLVWLNNSSLHPTTQVEESVPLNRSRKPTQTDNQPTVLGINPSGISAHKGTKNIPNPQTSEQKNAENPLNASQIADEVNKISNTRMSIDDSRVSTEQLAESQALYTAWQNGTEENQGENYPRLKDKVTELSDQQYFTMRDMDELTTRIDEELGGRADRKSGYAAVHHLLTNNPELAREFIRQNNINGTEELKNWCAKRQSKLRIGKGKEAREAAAQANVDAILGMAHRAAKESAQHEQQTTESTNQNEQSRSDNRRTNSEGTPKDEQSKYQRLKQERRERILREGTGFDKAFGLVSPKDITSPQQITDNIEAIVKGLALAEKALGEKGNTNTNTADITHPLSNYNGWVYGEGHIANAQHQIEGYLQALDVLDPAILNEWQKQLGIKTYGDLRNYVEKIYNETKAAQTAQLEAELSKPLSLDDKKALIKQISDGKTKVVLVTNKNIVKKLAELGATRKTIADMAAALSRGEKVNGFCGKGMVILNTDALQTGNDIIATYVHERQHLLTAAHPQLLSALTDNATADELAQILRTITGTTFYDQYNNGTTHGHTALADELVSYVMQEAYATGKDAAEVAQNYGINNETILQTLNNIDYEQRQSNSLSKARRDNILGRNTQSSSRQSGRNNQTQSQGGLVQQGSRPAGKGSSGTPSRGQTPERGEIADTPVSTLSFDEQAKSLKELISFQSKEEEQYFDSILPNLKADKLGVNAVPIEVILQENSIIERLEERVSDYVSEHYPTQANISALTDSPQGKQEREAMRKDPALAQLRKEVSEQQDAAERKINDKYEEVRAITDNPSITLGQVAQLWNDALEFCRSLDAENGIRFSVEDAGENLHKSLKGSTFAGGKPRVPKAELAAAYADMFRKQAQGQFPEGNGFAYSANYFHKFNNGRIVQSVFIDGNENLIDKIQQKYGIDSSTRPTDTNVERPQGSHRPSHSDDGLSPRQRSGNERVDRLHGAEQSDGSRDNQEIDRDTQSGRATELTDPRFSVSGTQVVPLGERTLVGLHNITSDKLRKVLKAGGLANPSAAVIDIAKQDHHGYGEISLVMPSSLVDSNSGNNAGTYTGDMWSPTYPATERRMSDKGADAYYKALNSAFGNDPARRGLWNKVSLGFSNWLAGQHDPKDFAYWYMLEKGITPENVLYNSGVPASVKQRFAPIAGKRLYEYSEEDRELLLFLIAEQRGITVGELKQEAQELRQRYQETLDDPDSLIPRKRIAQEAIEDIDTYGVKYNVLEKGIDDIQNAIRYDGKIDVNATLSKAEDYVQANYKDDFDKWLIDFDKRFGIKEYIFDGYTRNGDRKYIPDTLANASRLMNREELQNAGSHGGFNATKGQLIERMNTLADIRANKYRLTSQEGEKDGQWEQLSNEWFDNIIDPLSNMQKISDNQFSNVDYAEQRLLEALRQKDPIAHLNKEYGYSIAKDSAFAKALNDLVQRIKDLPAKYFETKFKRPVYLNEFRNAVIPNNLPQDLRDGLEQAGLGLYEYDPKAEGSRREATLQATEDDGIRFSVGTTLETDNTLTPEARKEMQAIAEQAKADGTFMQAPNGKPSNLNERQWLQVRTRAFKNWFGDWNAKHEAEVELPNRLAQWLSKENIEKAQGKSRAEIIKEFGNEPQAIAYIPIQFLPLVDSNLRDNRVYSGMGYFLDHAVNHHPNIAADKYQNIQQVLNSPDEVKAIVDNGNNSIVFIKQIDRYNAVVIEVEKTDDGRIVWHKSFYDQNKKPYANKGTRLYEMSSEGGISPIIRTDEPVHDSSLSVLDDAAKIQQNNGTTKSVDNYLRPEADFSKVIDENGEPLVVYHGTNRNTRKRFFGFDTSNADIWVTPAKGYADIFADSGDGKATIYTLFANVKKPANVGYIGSILDESELQRLADNLNIPFEELTETANRVGNPDYVWQFTASKAFANLISRYGYDGIQAREAAFDTYAALSPNQIKSATSNNGSFSENSDDIRFSIIGERNTPEAQYSELDYDTDNLTDAQQLATNTVLSALNDAGISVERVSEEQAEREAMNVDVEQMAVAEKFNDTLARYTDDNADNIKFDCGMPSEALLLAGMPNVGIRLNGEVLRKKMKAHQFAKEDVRNLPLYMQNPIAVFNGSHDNTFAVLTEMLINGRNTLVAIDIKGAEIQDFIEVSSLYDKNRTSVINWINDGKLLSVDKEKALRYIDTDAPIAPTGNNKGANSAAKVVQNFDSAKSFSGKSVETLRNSNGTIYGYAKDGKIYLTDRGLNPNTPIHEYTHLWVKVVRNNNAELYDNLRDLFSRENLPDMWDELDHDPQYRNLSDEAKLSEIIARFSGKRGAERMEQEAQKLIDEAKQQGKRAIADAVSFRERMRNLLRRFWNWVGEHLFRIKHFGSREEAADRVLYDLLNATNLHQSHSENDGKAEFSTSPMPKRVEGEMVHEWAKRIAEWKRQQVDEQQVAEYAKLLDQNGSKKSRLFAQIVDKFTPIDNFRQWVQAQGGVYNPDTMDMHADISLALGRIETFSRRYKNDYMQRIADSIKSIAKDADIADPLLALGLKWQNFDNKKMNGKPLTVREIMGVYAQAKDTWEAEQQGLSDRGAQGFVKNLGASHTDIIEAVERIIPQEQLDEFWNAVYAANQFALDYQLNAGMIDPDTRNRYTRRYYVPQRGWRERDFDGKDTAYIKDNGTRLYGNPYNAALVKARGRESLASDPFALIESIGLTSITQSEHNKSKQQLLNLLLANEMLGLKSGAWRVKQVWSKNVIDPRTGHIMRKPDGTPVQAEVTYAAPTQQEREHDADINDRIERLRKELRDLTQPAARAKREADIADLQDQLIYTGRATDTMLEHRTRDERLQHQVVVLRDGQQYVIELQDERLANAVNGNFGEAVKAYALFNKYNAPAIRYISGMLTQYNPRFAHRNFWRDAQAAFLNNLSEQGLAFTTRAMANIPAVQRTVWQYILADTYKNKESYGGQFGDYLREYFEAGAQTGFSFMPELERMAKDFDKMVKGENAWDKVWGKGVKGTLSLMTEASELTVRFAEYVTARQMGRSVQEAAKMAKNISVNFNQSGLMSKEMSKFFTFFNATIQGNMRFLMPYGKNKPKFGERALKFGAKFAGMAANFALLGFVSTWFQPDDPDDDTWFTEYDRMSNFILFGKVKIPVVHFFRMYYAAGVQAALAAQGRKTWKDAFYTAGDYALGELIPASVLQVQNLWDYDETTNTLELNPAKYAQAAAPSVISPLVDVAVNRDFKGSTVYRKKWDNDKKDITTAKRNTPQWAIDASNTLHRWSGGNPDVPYKGGNTDGWIDIKPNAIEHIAQGYFSGVWESLGYTAGFIWDGAHDTDVFKHATNWPFLRDLFRDYSEEKAYNQQYYSVLQKLEKYEKRVNSLSQDEFDAEEQTNRFRTFENVAEQLLYLPNPYDDEEATVTSQDVNDILHLDIQLNRNLFAD